MIISMIILISDQSSLNMFHSWVSQITHPKIHDIHFLSIVTFASTQGLCYKTPPSMRPSLSYWNRPNSQTRILKRPLPLHSPQQSCPFQSCRSIPQACLALWRRSCIACGTMFHSTMLCAAQAWTCSILLGLLTIFCNEAMSACLWWWLRCSTFTGWRRIIGWRVARALNAGF